MLAQDDSQLVPSGRAADDIMLSQNSAGTSVAVWPGASPSYVASESATPAKAKDMPTVQCHCRFPFVIVIAAGVAGWNSAG